jgi:hypothetical protein
MAYQSYFATKQSTSSAPPATGGGYKSYFTGAVTTSAPAAPSKKTKPKLTPQQEEAIGKADALKANKEAADKAKKAADNSLFNKFKRSATAISKAAVVGEKQFVTPVARRLPGGSADLDAQKKLADAEQARTKQIVTDSKAGKLTKEQASKQLKANSSVASKNTKQIIKDMPSKGQVLLGAASTAADIISGGTFGTAVKGAKSASIISKVKHAIPSATANAAAGGLNSAAGGGTKKDIVTNAGAGVAFPIVLGGAAKVTSRAANDILSKVRAPKKLLEEQQAKAAMEAASKQKTAKAEVEVKKIDQKIEQIEAKKGDGKYTNVDNVKVKQLKEQKAELTADSAPATKPVPQEAAVAPQEQPSKSATNGLENSSSKPSVRNMRQFEYTDTPMTPGEKRALAELDSNQAGTDYTVASTELRQLANESGQPELYKKVMQQVSDQNMSQAEATNFIKTGLKQMRDTGTNAKIKAGVKNTEPKTKGETNVNKIEATGKPTATVPSEPIGTRTLKPTETSHMPEVGGYTHSEHMAQDYADMLRTQERQVKGGQLVTDGKGGYKRISEHSRFYRDHYKEYKKAPTKADYLEQAKKELETGKDGLGAGADYKKLLEREAKPVERVKVESSVKDVPQGTSRVAQRIAKDLKAEHEDLAGYDKINWKDQANKAIKVTDDRELLDAIISGEKPLPDGLRATALLTAITKHPVLAKDHELLLKVAGSPLASESSHGAQELNLAKELAQHNPIEAIRRLGQSKVKVLERKTGKTVEQLQKAEVKAAQAAKPKVTKETWATFIESIKC